VMAAGIYALRNRITGRVYVGRATSLEDRRVAHLTELRGGYHANRHLTRDWAAHSDQRGRAGVDMPDVELSLELAGEVVPIEVVGETARELRRALEDIERHVTNADPQADWRWEDEAVLRAVASPNGVAEDTLRQVVQELRTGFQRAEEADGRRPAWPDTFGEKAKRAVIKILSHLKELDYITIETEGALPVTIDRVVVRKEIGRPVGYTEFTSIDGELDLISVRGRPSFTIQEHGTGKRIRCVFPDDMMPVVKDALGRRAVVEGIVRFREDGTPISINNITSLEVRPEPTRPIEELVGSIPNLTGGVSAVDYIRELRSGPEPV
jgi:hypothetical protein